MPSRIKVHAALRCKRQDTQAHHRRLRALGNLRPIKLPFHMASINLELSAGCATQTPGAELIQGSLRTLRRFPSCAACCAHGTLPVAPAGEAALAARFLATGASAPSMRSNLPAPYAQTPSSQSPQCTVVSQNIRHRPAISETHSAWVLPRSSPPANLQRVRSKNANTLLVCCRHTCV